MSPDINVSKEFTVLKNGIYMRNKILIGVIFMLLILCITLNAQNFKVDTMKISKRLRIKPTFDTLKLENRKSKLLESDSEFDYVKSFTKHMLKESLSQTQINKLKNSSLTIIVYIGNDGKVFYAFFAMSKDLVEVIKDTDLRTIYDKYKDFTFQLDKAVEDPRYSGDFIMLSFNLIPD